MGDSTKYLRPLKALDYEAWKNRYQEKNDLAVESYDNAMILPLKNIDGDDCGGVVDVEGKYVKLSSLFNSTWGHFNNRYGVAPMVCA